MFRQVKDHNWWHFSGSTLGHSQRERGCSIADVNLLLHPALYIVLFCLNRGFPAARNDWTVPQDRYGGTIELDGTRRVWNRHMAKHSKRNWVWDCARPIRRWHHVLSAYLTDLGWVSPISHHLWTTNWGKWFASRNTWNMLRFNLCRTMQ